MNASRGGPTGPWRALELLAHLTGYPELAYEIRAGYDRRRATEGPAAARRWLLRQLIALRIPIARGVGRGIAGSGTRTRQILRRLLRRPGLSIPFALVIGGGLAGATFMAEVRDAVLNPRLGIADDLRILMAVDSTGRTSTQFPMDETTDWTTTAPPAAGTLFTTAFGTGVVGTPSGLVSAGHALVSPRFVTGIGGALTEGRDVEAPGEVVLSHAFWRAHWGDRSPIGGTMTLGERQAEIVGVARPTFDGATCCVRPSFWAVPLDDGPRYARVVAVGVADSTAAAGQLAERLEDTGRGRLRVQLPLARAAAFGGERGLIGRSLRVIFQLALVALLAAILNGGNLLVADVLDRRRELAVRRAIGAGRSAVLSLILQQAAWLGLAAAAFALLLGAIMTGIAPRLLPFIGVDSVLDIGLGRLAYAVLALGTVAVVALCSLPATIAAGVVTPRVRVRTPSMGVVLVGAQAALGTVLVVLAGMLFGQSNRLDGDFFGFRQPEVGVFPIRAASADAAIDAPRILAAGRAATNGRPIAITRSMPVYGAPADSARLASGTPFRVFVEEATEGFFDVIGLRLVSGEVPRDGGEVAVSEDLLPELGGSPVGATLLLGEEAVTVVGVVERATWGTGEPRPTLYRGWAPERLSGGLLLLSPDGERPPALGSVVSALTPLGYAASWFGTLADLRVRSRVLTIFLQRLATLFAGLCLLVVVTGIYAHFTRWARTRRRELGIRHALGARPARLRGAVYGAAAPALLAGLGVGFAAAWYTGGEAARAIGVEPPGILLMMVGVLTVGATAVVTLSVPALRVVRNDPRALLTSE